MRSRRLMFREDWSQTLCCAVGVFVCLCGVCMSVCVCNFPYRHGILVVLRNYTKLIQHTKSRPVYNNTCQGKKGCKKVRRKFDKKTDEKMLSETQCWKISVAVWAGSRIQCRTARQCFVGVIITYPDSIGFPSVKRHVPNMTVPIVVLDEIGMIRTTSRRL